MRIFISHASKNREVVLKFAEFLEMLNSNIEVFCSSEKGSIKVGKNFIETIFKELDQSDIFIPVISQEYYDSKFCMIELGVAYSYLYNRYSKNGEDYIFPFSLYPIKKDYALSGTPLANLQTGDLCDESDIHSFLEYLSSEKGLSISGWNCKLHSLKFELDQIVLKKQDILALAKTNTFFDDSIEFNHRGDIANYSISDNTVVVNYNMNPYEKHDVKRPNFISFVLGYVDKLDIGHYLDFNDSSQFKFTITSFTNSLKRIFVEFKYSDNNRILETFEFPIVYGENQLSIPIEKMKSNALSAISEICFVIHPDDVVEDEGMYKISNMNIS